MAKQRGPDGVPFDIPTHKPQSGGPAPRHGDDQDPTKPPSRKRGRLFPEEPPTRPAGSARTTEDFSTRIVSPQQHPRREPAPASAGAEPRTRIYGGSSGGGTARQNEEPIRDAVEDPVTGWLVIVDGPGRGNFVRVGHGQNQIGRGASSRIRLDFGDELISRDNNGVITYDPLNRKFYVQQGTGANLLYMNSAPVLAPAELPDRAMLRVGATQLVFVAFCGEGFTWLGE